MKDWYQVLGMPSDASDDELRAAHRRAVRELHPDTRDPSLPADDADAALRLVNEAWELLRDPGRRAAYDRDHEEWDEPDEEELILRHQPRFPWWIVALAILLVIFVFTAYAGVPTNSAR